jgi:hypothetical protein
MSKGVASGRRQKGHPYAIISWVVIAPPALELASALVRRVLEKKSDQTGAGRIGANLMVGNYSFLAKGPDSL